MKLSRTPRVAIACLAATVVSAAGASAAEAAEFTNSQPISIADLGRTTPYPSNLGVSGLGPRATKVTLTIELDHSSKSDLEMLLVAPQGQKVLVMSDAAESSRSPVRWTFDDAAATGLGCGDAAPESPSGAYRPTNCERFPGDLDTLAAPAPPPPYSAAMAAFGGADPNGTWKLYVEDVGSGDDGTLRSWTLSIEAPAPPPRPVTCPAGNSAGVTCQQAGSVTLITGTGGSGTIVGTPGRDIIRCGDGSDRVSTGAGNDDIRCGAGDDRIDSGPGDDFVDGESGDDRIAGGPGRDRLSGSRGNDVLAGSSGRDSVSGGSGRDLARGGSGNDRLNGDSGSDRLLGDSGSDAVKGGSGNDRLLGGSGKDRLAGGSGRDRLSGGSGRDRLSGGSGRDKVRQ